MRGHLEVAMVNDKGQSVVRACYNLTSDSRRATFVAFYLTQGQMDARKGWGEMHFKRSGQFFKTSIQIGPPTCISQHHLTFFRI
jgi:hypothetical protein